MTLTVIREREAKMNELYRIATGVEGTTKSRGAFDDLSSYRGQYAKELILRIATEKPVLDLGRNRVAAIRAIAKWRDAGAAERLAGLLQSIRGTCGKRSCS